MSNLVVYLAQIPTKAYRLISSKLSEHVSGRGTWGRGCGILIITYILITQVKCQAGYRRDPGNPTQDPRWEWRDPTFPTWDENLIPPGIPHLMRDSCIPPGILGGTYAF